MTNENTTDDRRPILRDRSLWSLTVTQFLGAFNDNIYKQFVLLVCVAGGGLWQPTAQFVFALPFVLGSWFSGAIADRVSKRSLIVLCKVLEVGVMLAAVGVLLATPTGSDVRRVWLIVVLAFMAVQSTLFGPPKYGSLPELFRGPDLPVANGVIQLTTFLAIIFGAALAGILKAHLPPQYAWAAGLVCVGIAVIGVLTAYGIRPTPAAEPDMVITPRSAWIDADVSAVLKRDRLLLGVLLLSTLFWFLGSVLQQAVNGFGVRQMGWGDDHTSYLQAILGLGIALGCGLAAKLSRGMADFPLVRKSAGAMLVFLLLIALVPEFADRLPRVYAIELALFFSLGVATGLFAVPLQTFLQTRPPEAIKGRMIGTMNTYNFIGILLGAAAYAFFGLVFGTDPGEPISRTFFVVAACLLPVVIWFRTPAQSLESS